MASDQTPIEKARQWYLDYYDLHDLAVNGLAKGDEQTIELLAAFAAHVEAQRPVSYAMSKDYEALYNHLCNGGEALAKCLDSFDEDEIVGTRMTDADIVDGRDWFISECTRLNLEWLAPAQPLDPDAHITDADAYLKAKIERAKDVDFDGIEAARNPTGWIPVEERLPENRATVLTFFRHGEQDICFFYDGNWSGHSASTVTHWMHLPSAP